MSSICSYNQTFVFYLSFHFEYEQLSNWFYYYVNYIQVVKYKELFSKYVQWFKESNKPV